LKAVCSRVRERAAFTAFDYLGAASIAECGREIAQIGGSLPDGYLRAITIRIVLPGPIVDRLKQGAVICEAYYRRQREASEGPRYPGPFVYLQSLISRRQIGFPFLSNRGRGSR
jgi:hypothetical protein